MQSAALFILASSASVLFGWQPMPDGSPSYEYIVQLDPELVATLKQGQSIPLTVDVPEDIQPISRIRIVVGNDTLPRQQLTTANKPLPKTSAKKSREGIILAQHRVQPVEPTGSGRYPAQTQTTGQILPPSNNQTTSSQGFAQALQRAAQPVNNSATSTNQILPPGSNNFNSTIQSTAQNINNTVQDTTRSLNSINNQITNEILPDARQLFNQANSVGNSLQRTAQQAQNTFNQNNTSARDRSVVTTNQNTQNSAPPNNQIFPPNNPNQQSAPATGTASNSQSNNQQAKINNPANWQSSQPNTSNNQITSNNPQNAKPKWPHSNQTPSNSSTLQPPEYSQPKNQSTDQRYANTPSTTSNPSTSQPAQNNTGFSWKNDARFTSTPTNTPTNSQSSVPFVTKDMLKQPADAELSVASRPKLPAPPTQQDRAFVPTSTSPAINTQADGRNSQQNGWDRFNNTSQQQTSQEPDERPDTFMLVLSWVLLSGSGFGNVYLLWNYYDIRHKYRGLVHNARGSNRSYSSLD